MRSSHISKVQEAQVARIRRRARVNKVWDSSLGSSRVWRAAMPFACATLNALALGVSRSGASEYLRTFMTY